MVTANERISRLKTAIGDFDGDVLVMERVKALQMAVEFLGSPFDSKLACLSASLSGMAAEVAELKRTVAQHLSSSSSTSTRDIRLTTTKVQIPKPTTFNGVRRTKELENFL